MSSSTDEHAIEPQTDTGIRSLFRRSRRDSEVADDDHAPLPTAATTAVATVDDMARRMDELVAGPRMPAPSDTDVRAAFELQRAAIARANELVAAPQTAPTPTAAPEAPAVNQPAPTTPAEPANSNDDAEIQARLDAVLAPVELPVNAPAPTVAAAQPDPVAPAAELRPTTPTPVQGAAPASAPRTASHSAFADAAPTASAVLGIDVGRLVQLLEDEAVTTRQRMEIELRSAEAQAAHVVDAAEAEAERIREHGQAQARVLLGEVEEIISEAQATGEQILHRANEEATTLRTDATSVLQQAQSEARAIVETARREGEQVLAEQRRLATVRAQEAMREQDRLKDQIRRLEERRRQVLESLEPLISQLTQMMPAGGAEAVTQLNRVRDDSVVSIARRD